MTWYHPRMTNSDLTRQFSFEEDWGDPRACLPMAVRYKLDTAGIKLQLEEWAEISDEDRRALLAWPFDSERDVLKFAERMNSLVKSRAGREPGVFVPGDQPEWLDPQRMPEAVQERAETLGVTMSTAQWSRLSPLQRFALVKLSLPKYSPERLRPALEEFGIA
ncbi:MAG TPA: nitrate reductase associated protein [bacterium]|nr:nitrate reductase associated protein [bacterium]